MMNGCNHGAPECLPALRVLLVSDLVGFTAMVQMLGDELGVEYIRLHNAWLRRCLREEQGREIAHTGDGMITSFENAERALRCASLIQRTFSEQNAHTLQVPMRLRLGLHAGRPQEEEGRLFGTCVNTAVRVCAAAKPEQVLLSSSVLQLLNGLDITVSDRGMHALRGLREPVHVYALDWRQPIACLPAAPLGSAA